MASQDSLYSFVGEIMNKELDEKLVKTFPNLYAKRYASMQETCMCWGFDCDDGWFDIIWELSEKLEKLGGVVASQVKEKYGTLRFYADWTRETDEKLAMKYISEAEEKSAVTCEITGKPGKLISYRGWLMVRCDEELAKLDQSKIK